MNIIPAIDIKSGECVRLYQGCYDKITTYSNNPVAVAKSFAEQGAQLLHVVDLDGAKQGNSVNLALIKQMAQETGLNIQTGGGIRTKQQVAELLEVGFARVVLGSIAVTSPEEVSTWVQEFGYERITLALDIRMNDNLPQLAIHGWQTASLLSLWELLDKYPTIKHVLCTDIQFDGTLQGPNINLYKEAVKKYPSIHFQASGGIGSLKDLDLLSSIPVASVIIGKALYENKFSLRDAFNEVSVC